MLVLKFNGGLGNQMFQFALYKKLESLGRQVRADLRDFVDKSERRNFYLEKLGIRLEVADDAQLRKYAPDYNKVNLVKNKLGLMKKVIDEPTYVFKGDVLRAEDAFVDGYWQCPKYFDDLRNDIVDDVCFPALPENQEEVRNKMIAENSVTVHVRLGDYLKFSEKYGGICTKEYYLKAFDFIESRIHNPVYYGFSDDISLAKEMFSDRNIAWLDLNSEEDACNDLYLMSSCRHNIIANSSFSWWGAYLGRNEDKIVIAPSKWINSDVKCDIWCADWIKL